MNAVPGSRSALVCLASSVVFRRPNTYLCRQKKSTFNRAECYLILVIPVFFAAQLPSGVSIRDIVRGEERGCDDLVGQVAKLLH